MKNNLLLYYINRVREKLWVRPLLYIILSVTAVFIAKLTDDIGFGIERIIPNIEPESIEELLSVLSASMLVISTLAVTSMVSAYSAASTTTTPRSFSLIISDDASQNALSTFIGAFIFSVVAIVSVKNSYFGKVSNFTLFIFTILAFTIVILTFLRWVDRIARLGRIGHTIDKVETATSKAIVLRQKQPTLGGMPISEKQTKEDMQAIYSDEIGYIQHINMNTLQKYAEDNNLQIVINALPGTFALHDRAIAFLYPESHDESEQEHSCGINEAFLIGKNRTFEQDPRFGLIALSEIAARALSPAINDPGTAIAIITSFVRLFGQWAEKHVPAEQREPKYDRVEVPELCLDDMFKDAFTALARDGAAYIEVSVRLQKAYTSFAALGNESLTSIAQKHAKRSYEISSSALQAPADKEYLEEVYQRSYHSHE